MSDSAARIRKQVYELTAQDFLDHAIWEFCSDETGLEGQDEATVRPTNKTELTDELPGACVIAAKVGFADGSWGTGYLYNCRQDDIGCLQPNLLAGASQVNFWLGWLRFIPNAAERVQVGYRKIGKTNDAVFPASFESTLKVKGQTLKAIVPGFMALGLDGKTVVVE
jgi:hypothetical protein